MYKNKIILTLALGLLLSPFFAVQAEDSATAPIPTSAGTTVQKNNIEVRKSSEIINKISEKKDEIKNKISEKEEEIINKVSEKKDEIKNIKEGFNNEIKNIQNTAKEEGEKIKLEAKDAQKNILDAAKQKREDLTQELKTKVGEIKESATSTAEQKQAEIKDLRDKKLEDIKANIEVRKEEIKLNIEKKIEDLKSNIEIRKSEILKKISEKKDEIKTKLVAKAQEKVKATLEKIYTNLNSKIEKLSEVDAKILTRISTAETNGKDIVSAKAQYTIARAALDKAITDIAATKTISIDQTSIETSKEALRSLVKTSEESIKIAGVEYQKVIPLIARINSEVKKVENTTNTVTQ